MSAVLNTQGADYLLRFQLGLAKSANMTLRLFVNDYDPVQNDWPINYTECALTGYSSVPLDGSQWSGFKRNGVATYNYPAQYWSFPAYDGPAVTIYGYYLTDPGNTLVVWAERFPTPFPVPNAGTPIYLALQWIDSQAP